MGGSFFLVHEQAFGAILAAYVKSKVSLFSAVLWMH